MSERPSCVVFDLGKVLVEFDYSRAGRALAAQAEKSAEEIRALVDQTGLLFRFETGLMTTQEFFNEVQKATGYRGSFEEFTTQFGDIFTPIPEMLDLHAGLRARGLPTFIFSNTNDLEVKHIRRTFPFFSQFDDYIYSYEHGAMKPQAKLYEVVESVTDRRGKDILYIDDRHENIVAGAERGWQAVLHETPVKTREAVERLLGW